MAMIRQRDVRHLEDDARPMGVAFLPVLAAFVRRMNVRQRYVVVGIVVVG